MNDTDQSAITRPRMAGADANCRVAFPLERNRTLVAPTATRVMTANGTVRASAVSRAI